MGGFLVSVSASNEKHGSTIGNSCKNGAGRNTSAGRIDLAAPSSISWKTTAMSALVRCPWRRIVLVGSWAGSTVRERAVWEGPSRVDESSQLVDNVARLTLSIYIVVEGGRRLPDLVLQGDVRTLGYHKDSKRSDPTLVLGSVSSPETVIDDLILLDANSLRDSLLQICEDLVSTATPCYEVVVKAIVEADLTQEHVFR